ncbi:AMP-binding enzyme [Streptomyces cellulosae]|uniref:AMP-binding enzyme C-terminal domain-containing protein n=1 Tax=Streptomyces cellulosae TaxID=1968 RepID=A0ABW7YG60_STRCE
MIIRGGFNVYPREVEEVLMEHPAVSLAAVIAVPHESHGQEIKAVVVQKAGSGTTEEELTTWAKERLAAYKYPRGVQFVDELPLTSTGKILKRTRLSTWAAWRLRRPNASAIWTCQTKAPLPPKGHHPRPPCPTC